MTGRAAATAPQTTTVNPHVVLEVEGLSVHDGAGRALVENVHLRVERGERVGIIGESGSGKSMTALSLLGLLPEGVHASGAAHLGGVNVLTASQAQLRRVRGAVASMVFQEPLTALNPTMRVGKQIEEVLAVHAGRQKAKHAERNGEPAARTRAERKRVAIDLLSEMAVPNPEQSVRAYPFQLSGGQRQRVLVAIALANDPALLICDEPTTALDVTVQAFVLDRIVHAAEARGTAVLFISHDIAVVGTVCDRILVMKNGRIVEAGTTAEVLGNPQHPYTQELVRAGSHSATRRVDAHVERTAVRSTTPAIRTEGATQQQAVEDAATPPAIEITDVSRVYGRLGTGPFAGRGRRVQALDEVDLTVPAGQRLGIVGESGCGKSTLLRLVAGLDQPTSGVVRVDGKQVSGRKESQLGFLRDRLQVVFQDPAGSLDPRMKVWESVAEPLRAVGRHMHRERVWELLEAVGLDQSAATRYPHEFSGGQRQRIAIARALAPEPSILLADEPVSALDVTVRAQILDLLTGLADRLGFTLVLVSHDLFVVHDVCERVVVMRGGRIVEDGEAREVHANPQHPYTRRLTAAVPTVESALARVRQENP